MTARALDLPIPFSLERLDNGLTVVAAPHPGLPIVTVDVTYDVGSRVEPEGRTGLAHLFEHLMFEGSERVPKGEHFRRIAEAGGTLNGTTSEDRTNYFETLPVEWLDLALFLEADRMRALDLSQEKLENQRLAVKEEKRLRVDNQPYAASFETADALAYDSFPYRHSVIGSMEDLDAASLDDLSAFYERYYAPGNALLCVVGDVEPADVFQRARRIFGEVPTRPLPPPVTDEEPEPDSERRTSTVDPHAAVPALHLNFRIPPRRHRSTLALVYVEKILAGGESGRLWRRLVKDDELALSFSMALDERRGPSLLRLFALARPDVTLEWLESEIRADLARFAEQGPTPREMERARRLIASDAVRSTQTVQSVAFLLSEYGLYDRDPGLFRNDLDQLLSMEAAEVQAAAAAFLVPERLSVVRVDLPAEPVA